MSLKYRISDNGTEIGPVDLMEVRAMFKGSISNRAKICPHGTEESWESITAQFPLWGRGREKAAPTRKHRKLIAAAGGSRKPRAFRSKPLGLFCFCLVPVLIAAPFVFDFWMEGVVEKDLAEIEIRYAPRATGRFEDFVSSENQRAEARRHEHERLQRVRDVANYFFRWGSLPGAVLLIWWGRRLRSRSAEEVMAKDPRAPVLYFRSFEEDLQFAQSPLDRVAPRGYGLGKYRTEEEQIVEELERIGPVIAIGNPDEKVPLLGAHRLYTTDDTWQNTAQQLLAGAALVVYRVGTTPGFLWEVKRGRQHLSPRRVLILLPPWGDRFPPPGYSEFRKQMADTLSLPEFPEGPVIAFQENWVPEIMRAAPGEFYRVLRTIASSRKSRPRRWDSSF